MQSCIKDRLASKIQVFSSQVQGVNTGDDDMMCPICSNLIWEPVGCATCKLHLCLKCIQDWLKAGKLTCPISGCKQFVDEKPHPYFYKHLSSLQLLCENKEKGCNEKVNYEGYERHQRNDCQFVDEKCQNEGCDALVQRGQFAAHVNDCIWGIVLCEFCQKELRRKDKQEHEAYLCESYPMECKHKGCGERIRRAEYKEHLQNCKHKLDMCAHCSGIYDQSERHFHEDRCPERKRECRGCKLIFTQLKLETHLKECKDIKVKCELCDQEFPQFEYRSLHNSEECTKGVVLQLLRENEQLRRENEELKVQQSESDKKIKDIMNTLVMNRHNSQTIEEQEKAIHQAEAAIMIIFENSSFISHQKKKHGMNITKAQEAIRHFHFLESTSHLYYGWHKFHCSDCMTFVTKLNPQITPIVDILQNSQALLNQSKLNLI